jgi:hypothetical protein
MISKPASDARRFYLKVPQVNPTPPKNDDFFPLGGEEYRLPKVPELLHRSDQDKSFEIDQV